MILIAKRTVMVLAALTLVFGLSSEACATAYSYSMMDVRNLSITFGPSQPFSCPNCFFTSDTSALLGGVPDGHNAFSFTAGTTVDPAEAFVGAGGPNPGPNSFGQVGAAGPSYARGDSILTSTLVNTNPGPATGAFKMVGETAVIGALSGSGNATNNQTWNLTTFHLIAGNTAAISFDIDALALAQTTAVGEASDAHLDFIFTLQALTGGGGVDINCALGLASSSTSPGLQDQTETSVIAPGCAAVGSFTNVASGSLPGFNHITFTMTVGVTGDYQFKLGADTPVNAAAQAVPEPMSLMLLGVGLSASALVGIRRRRTTKAGAEV